MNTDAVTLESVRQAQTRLVGGLRLTRCVHSAPLSELAGMKIILKHEHEQVTGSFKERGARNALLSLLTEERRAGVISASAGNHALGLARHGGLLGVSVTVVMPESAPRVKAERCRLLGAQVILHGLTYEDSAVHAQTLGRERKLTYIHPFDDLAVIAGQGTMALEILDQVREVDAVVVPVGGGGLLAGVAVVIKALRPDVQVIGVEAAHAAGMAVALRAGRPVRVPVSASLADGLAVAQAGQHTHALAQRWVDEVVTVTEDELATALLRLAEEDIVAEGAGAAGLAACLSRKMPALAGKRVAVPVTGRNIDPSVHTQALWRAQMILAQQGLVI